MIFSASVLVIFFRIGMLPDLPLNSYKPLGNSSLGGAALALVSDKFHLEIDQIRDRITYLELNVNQDFMNRFSAAKFLPHTNMSLFPSVKLWNKRKQQVQHRSKRCSILSRHDRIII